MINEEYPTVHIEGEGHGSEKELRSDIKRNTLLLVGNNIVFWCIAQIILVVSPIVILDSTGSLALGGLATALVLSGDMLTNYHAGKLADIIGRKKTLLIGTAVGIVGLLAMAASRLLFEDLWYWIGLVIFSFSTGILVLNRAAIMDMYPRKRGLSLGFLNTGSFVGSFLAPILISGMTALAILIGKNYYDLLIFACLPLLALAGFLLMLIRKDTQLIAQILDDSKPQPETKEHPLKKDPWVLGAHGKRDLALAFIISSLSVGGVAIAYSLCPMFLHILDTEIGLISFSVALISVGTAGLSMVLGKLADKFGRKRIVILGATIMGAGLFILPLAQNYIIISAANFLTGLGAGAIAIASTAFICDIVAPKNRGKVFGANSFVINIPTLVLPPLAATLVAISGPLAVSILGIAIAVVVTLSMISISRKAIL